MMVIQPGIQGVNLSAKSLVFSPSTDRKPARNGEPLRDASRREPISISSLVIGNCGVADPHTASFNKSAKSMVGTSIADANCADSLALRLLVIPMQEAEVTVFLKSLALTGHQHTRPKNATARKVAPATPASPPAKL
jgi:hypothetical protein